MTKQKLYKKIDVKLKNIYEVHNLTKHGLDLLRSILYIMIYHENIHDFKIDTTNSENGIYILKGKIKEKWYDAIYSKTPVNNSYLLGSFFVYMENKYETEKIIKLGEQGKSFTEKYKIEHMKESSNWDKSGVLYLIIIIIIGVISFFTGVIFIFGGIYFMGVTIALLWNSIWYWKRSSWSYILLTPWLSWTYFIL